MRDIKFRAWDTHAKCMHPGFTLHEIVQIMRQSNPPGIEAVAYQFGFREFIFQQYTGLKDKNGKEIFEGDVVTIEGSQFTARIEFRNGQWVRHVNEYELRNQLYEFNNGIYGSDKYHCEVIGNIYEHEHLLLAHN